MEEQSNVGKETLKKLDLLTDKLTELVKIQRKAIMGYEYVNIVELSDIIGESVNTIYGRVHRNEIPFYKPGGKTLTFKVEEIKDWVKATRHSTMEEMRQRI